jgi:hypothetical protein
MPRDHTKGVPVPHGRRRAAPGAVSGGLAPISRPASDGARAATAGDHATDVIVGGSAAATAWVRS